MGRSSTSVILLKTFKWEDWSSVVGTWESREIQCWCVTWEAESSIFKWVISLGLLVVQTANAVVEGSLSCLLRGRVSSCFTFQQATVALIISKVFFPNSICFYQWVTFVRASLVTQTVKILPAMQDTWVLSLGQEDLLENRMATHSNIFAWRIPWTAEPGWLYSPWVCKESGMTESLTCKICKVQSYVFIFLRDCEDRSLSPELWEGGSLRRGDCAKVPVPLCSPQECSLRTSLQGAPFHAATGRAGS